MRQVRRMILIGALLATGIALALLLSRPAVSAPQPAEAATWQAKVDPAVLAAAQTAGESEFLLYLTEQAALGRAARLPNKESRGAFVYEQLRRTAQRSQAPIRRVLDGAGATYRSYWIANMFWVRADAALIQALARRPDVAHLYANPRLRLAEPLPQPAPRLPAAIPWGLTRVNAPDVWAEGITGQGIVVGGQDTGYQWDHPALKNQYRGWNGSNVNHNYNWHDAIHADSNTGGSSSCGVDLTEPCDDNGHGTHTMGTMVGDDGGSNQIGMAPGARWMSCRNMEGGWGTPATYSECFQWFVAPTDLDDQNPDPTLAPDVINNSWTCPASEGCTDPEILKTVVENVRAAGIVVVVSAGNSGPSCETVRTPAAIYEASFTIGATDSGDNIASFSSRGPVTVDGSGRRKPDIAAPGVSVYSSYRLNSYAYLNGTSMAGPHVAGQVALLLAANPGLRGQVAEIEALIESSALPLTTNQGCGGDSPTAVPNNVFGHGRIDAQAAVNAVPPTLALTKTTPVTTVTQGELLTYTLQVSNSHRLKLTNNLVLTDVLPAGTTFVTATRPYTLAEEMVSWYTPTLAPAGTWEVELVVRVTLSSTGAPHAPALPLPGREPTAIVNEFYGVRSDETASTGVPVSTRLPAPTQKPRIFLPLLAQ